MLLPVRPRSLCAACLVALAALLLSWQASAAGAAGGFAGPASARVVPRGAHPAAGAPASSPAKDSGGDTGAASPLDVTLLACLQGLTEFLPVSSSGHLVLAGRLLGLRESGLILPVALHLGTLLAVLMVYRAAVVGIARDVLRGRWRYAGLLLCASVPAAFAGILLEDWFRERFSDATWAAIGLLGTSLILAVADVLRRRARPPLRDGAALRWSDALAIGCAQAVAILPGVSRSGSTIGIGLARGLHPEEAARFSFLMSLIAVGGAVLLEARHLGGPPDPSEPAAVWILWGVAVSFVLGWLSLRLLIRFLGRGVLRWFALYTATVAALWLSSNP